MQKTERSAKQMKDMLKPNRFMMTKTKKRSAFVNSKTCITDENTYVTSHSMVMKRPFQMTKLQLGSDDMNQETDPGLQLYIKSPSS